MLVPSIFGLIDRPVINHPAIQEIAQTVNQSNNQTHNPKISPPPESKPAQALVVLPVGINVGKRNVLQSSSVRGYEDGAKAVNFDKWLVPFSDLTKALNLTITNLADGQIEIRGSALIKRIDPQALIEDPELGLAISVAKIEQLLEVKTEFDIAAYAIVLNPPWLNFQGNNKTRVQEPPVILEGLPVVNAPSLSISTVGQDISISGNQNSSQLSNQGVLTAIGSISGSSWFARINQPDLLKTNTWQLQEAQFFKQGEFSDYAIGSQPIFWQSQGAGEFWGFTTIQRFGFKADSLNGTAFSPVQRLYSNTINRTIEGAAAPNTLVQLVTGSDNTVINQVLVDSSGVYRFNNVPVNSNGGNYRILLYANGQLANPPIQQEAIFLNLPGQLTTGTSSLIASAGLGRQLSTNSSLGNFTDLRGGVAYRQGVSDALTLGAGLAYDKSTLGFADIFYQPHNLPLTLALSAFQASDRFKYNANLQLKPSDRLSFNIFSNEQYQSYSLNWGLLSNLNFSSNGNNLNNIVNAAIALNQNIGAIATTSNIKIDNIRQLDWSFNARLLRNLNFTTRANATTSSLALNYDAPIFNLSGDETSTLSYETLNVNNLLTLKWKYRSPFSPSDRRSDWDWDFGYGIGSQGSGLIASIATTFIPGLSLRFRYDGISTTSNSSSFRLELVSSTNLSPYVSPADTQFENLRSQGGILIQPFLDRNNNGVLDKDEEIYTKDLDLLLLINNQKFNPSFANINAKGILIKLEPQIYRVDLDPSGYPLDWKPTQTAIAVEVVAGSYTAVAIPFVASYTLAGTLKDAKGNPVSGAKVEAISQKTGNRIFSITNSSGVFYLEQLQQETYNLQVNGKTAEPAILKITPTTDTLSELNLKLL